MKVVLPVTRYYKELIPSIGAGRAKGGLNTYKWIFDDNLRTVHELCRSDAKHRGRGFVCVSITYTLCHKHL